MSVLSSISSHILHQIFYNLLVKYLHDPQIAIEMKLSLIKIAEKIISICQGDIILTPSNLDSLLTLNQLGVEGFGNSGVSLWQNIRTKILVNYSLKGMTEIVSWLVEQFVSMSEKDELGSKEMN